MNIKPGALETPDVLRSGNYRFTVWFEQTAANFALLNVSERTEGNSASANRAAERSCDEHSEVYNVFSPTPQTLHIVGEVDES